MTMSIEHNFFELSNEMKKTEAIQRKKKDHFGSDEASSSDSCDSQDDLFMDEDGKEIDTEILIQKLSSNGQSKQPQGKKKRKTKKSKKESKKKKQSASCSGNKFGSSSSGRKKCGLPDQKFEFWLKRLLPTETCCVCDEFKAPENMKGKVPRDWPPFERLMSEDGKDLIIKEDYVNDNEVPICISCYSGLKAGIVPVNSIKNNDFGTVPEELSCLNCLEEKMIALYVCNTKIVVLPFGQCARIGGVAYVMNDLVANMEVLPRMPNETDTILCVPKSYVQRGKQPAARRGNNDERTVRPNMVKRALLWLIKHNPLYKKAHDEGRIRLERLEELCFLKDEGNEGNKEDDGKDDRDSSHKGIDGEEDPGSKDEGVFLEMSDSDEGEMLPEDINIVVRDTGKIQDDDVFSWKRQTLMKEG